MPTLSIIIPVYNERHTILPLLKRVESVDFKDVRKEIIIVDDGSTDGTTELLQQHIVPRHIVLFHENNKGKGTAIRTGLKKATGDFLVVQDADLEYEPHDLLFLLAAMEEKQHPVVFGSRALGKNKTYSSYIFHIGGKMVTWWTNVLFGTSLTDEATCYKMFTRPVLNAITLTCTGFEFCPEFTAKVLNAGYAIHEVPISYMPRGKKEGKKIKVKDGLTAFWTLLTLRLTRTI
ncbi:MAG TPA: glycosyl transferase [Candidatus Magasanikbacteria bacterium]|nr:MAG: glycosyl transferase [Candidatus Magasanikbacteria bacterium RIFCSPLOWO2_02_FULL_47_16]OGH79364.1 MAG: glycosyl transferase [Candidatus Magasanikbacteria bacterium RIFCSPHIGHO2_02_FULL_48_18]OGH83516.1 MAG: glycosyl transferase [Candidatus Magasanikbacteria bacterium RIFCSPLOWO2_12_FULL_47_9b]HAZ28778.1 glycosyl transferase [Candidatus Magasanikbacteria bacterium]